MPHGREGGRDLLAEIPVQVRQAVGVLALRRDRDPAPQDLEKRAVVEKAHGPLNGGVARHGLLRDRYGDGTGTAWWRRLRWHVQCAALAALVEIGRAHV